MKEPIVDFIKKYSESGIVRAHMPGHKGRGKSEFLSFDITEIKGADSLYEADGIIAESEGYASEIFGANTYFSTEGSSLSIKAMLYLALMAAREEGRAPIIAAGRNAHKSFVNAVALLDIDVVWLGAGKSYLSGEVDLAQLKEMFSSENAPFALYITSPDYLGNLINIEKISALCREFGVMLLVDNAHGAYLKFLTPSRHPIDLGADMCCDSAHKTLSALTGAAYLHISKKAPPVLNKLAKRALSIFGSTSPSYPIMASLDALNGYLDSDYRKKLSVFCEKVSVCKQKITNHGYVLLGDEPLKICVDAKSFGYEGTQLASLVRDFGIECEFSDPDYLVLMLSPENTDSELERIAEAFIAIPKRDANFDAMPEPFMAEKAMSPRAALLSPSEQIPVSDSLGRVLAFANVSCPPAVPILAMGEIINERAIEVFKYYGIESVLVVK